MSLACVPFDISTSLFPSSLFTFCLLCVSLSVVQVVVDGPAAIASCILLEDKPLSMPTAPTTTAATTSAATPAATSTNGQATNGAAVSIPITSDQQPNGATTNGHSSSSSSSSSTSVPVCTIIHARLRHFDFLGAF